VDIAANCGTPIKAICSGWLSVLGRGLTGDPVFGGASQGGQDGLQLEHEDCYISEFRGYRSFYGCVEIPDKARRRVEIGETIGYVGVCEAEKQQGCHLHFGITKSSLDKSEDPNICERLGNILDETKSVLASKGELDNPASASIPLLFKDRAGNLVVSIGQG
jgi:murein DD-endopeptidase MepM/ murein hydrolase activator NlpD